MYVQTKQNIFLPTYNIQHYTQVSKSGEQEEKAFTCDRVQAYVETVIESRTSEGLRPGLPYSNSNERQREERVILPTVQHLITDNEKWYETW